QGTYFFDYGNAFLLQTSKAGAKIYKNEAGDFINRSQTQPGPGFAYPSYVQDIMGPMCFDYGFGPFRWVCASADPGDLKKTDELALQVMQDLKAEAPEEIQQQMADNIHWI